MTLKTKQSTNYKGSITGKDMWAISDLKVEWWNDFLIEIKEQLRIPQTRYWRGMKRINQDQRAIKNPLNQIS